MRNWQPIETAPKDGTEFLAFARGQFGEPFWGVAMWVEADPDMNPHIPKEELNFYSWRYRIRPAFWQPLPEPPAQETENNPRIDGDDWISRELP